MKEIGIIQNSYLRLPLSLEDAASAKEIKRIYQKRIDLIAYGK